MQEFMYEPPASVGQKQTLFTDSLKIHSARKIWQVLHYKLTVLFNYGLQGTGVVQPIGPQALLMFTSASGTRCSYPEA